jgi:hypothetical protein
VPPVAATVPEYAVPTVPPGRVVVVMESGVTAGAMVTEKVAEAVPAVGVAESVTVTMTDDEVPAVVGVPVMAPVDESMLRPAGNPVADQVYGVVPPVAATVAEYAVPTVPPGSVVVVMASLPAKFTKAAAGGVMAWVVPVWVMDPPLARTNGVVVPAGSAGAVSNICAGPGVVAF